jgi:hypothetical protein
MKWRSYASIDSEMRVTSAYKKSGNESSSGPLQFWLVLFAFVVLASNAHIPLHEHRFKPPFIGIVSSSHIIVSLYLIIFIISVQICIGCTFDFLILHVMIRCYIKIPFSPLSC